MAKSRREEGIDAAGDSASIIPRGDRLIPDIARRTFVSGRVENFVVPFLQPTLTMTRVTGRPGVRGRADGAPVIIDRSMKTGQVLHHVDQYRNAHSGDKRPHELAAQHTDGRAEKDHKQWQTDFLVEDRHVSFDIIARPSALSIALLSKTIPSLESANTHGAILAPMGYTYCLLTAIS